MKHLIPLILLAIWCLAGCTKERARTTSTVPTMGCTMMPITIPMTPAEFFSWWLKETQTSTGRVSAIDMWYWNSIGRAVNSNFSIEQPCDLIIQTDTYPLGDTNFDGIVNFVDYAYMAETWKEE